MTNYDALYVQAKKNLSGLSLGEFRFADICDNPPAGLGRRFREDVEKGVYPNVKFAHYDERSDIYEKMSLSHSKQSE